MQSLHKVEKSHCSMLRGCGASPAFLLTGS